MVRSWERLFSQFRVSIEKPYESGGVHAGSFAARRAIGRSGDGGRRDSFIVDEKLLASIVAYLKSLHATRPATEEFDICILHTHPRRIGGVPLARIESLPPSATDLKEVLDAGLPQEIDELVGRRVRYREAVVDAKGMWIFERGSEPASVEMTMESSRRIHDAQLAWARFVLANRALSVAELTSVSQYRELLSVYATLGVALSYVDHETAARMPLCRTTIP